MHTWISIKFQYIACFGHLMQWKKIYWHDSTWWQSKPIHDYYDFRFTMPRATSDIITRIHHISGSSMLLPFHTFQKIPLFFPTSTFMQTVAIFYDYYLLKHCFNNIIFITWLLKLVSYWADILFYFYFILMFMMTNERHQQRKNWSLVRKGLKQNFFNFWS